MKAEAGGPKRARMAIKSILAGEDFTIRVRQLDGKSWGWRRGLWIAWVESCSEDEFGLLAKGETPEHAVWRLGSDLQRVVHAARIAVSEIDTKEAS